MLHAHPLPVRSRNDRTSALPVFARCVFILQTMFLATLPTVAQQADKWYFGNMAGIDFSTGAPVVLLDGQMKAYEGAASICDENGNLLFYTNGGRVLTSNSFRYGGVYDREHQMMPNGDLELSAGCNSAKQGSLIVQDPGNTLHYYLFTLDCAEHGVVGGLRYCEVDMTLNGGLGDVTAIGTPLLDGVTESMVGIRHANGTDVWVLVHGVDNGDFHAFLVSASGISGAVTTTIGPLVDDQPGDMAVDLTSTKVHYSTSDNSILLDFDPLSGELSNLLDLGRSVIGCAFSRGGRFLYTCEFFGSKRVFQYDLLAPDIVASEQVLASDGNAAQAALRLAPDGKIYIAHWEQPALGVINHPDSAGSAAGYQYEGVDLLGRSCAASMPAFVNDLILTNAVGIDESNAGPVTSCMVRGDELWIRCDTDPLPERFSIFRSDGTLIQEGGMTGSTTVVPVAQYAPGIYVARIAGPGQRSGSTPFAIAR